MTALARADAFRGLGLDGRAAAWEGSVLPRPFSADELPLFAAEPAAVLPAVTPGERTVLDHGATELTLRDGHHPMALLRPRLDALGLADTRALLSARRGAEIRLPGLVLVRQRPGSSRGVVFITVEDEHGVGNLVLRPDVVSACRAAVVSARLAVAEGRIERDDRGAVPILHLVVRRLLDRSDLLDGLHLAGNGPEARLPRSRDFH